MPPINPCFGLHKGSFYSFTPQLCYIWNQILHFLTSPPWLMWFLHPPFIKILWEVSVLIKFRSSFNAVAYQTLWCRSGRLQFSASEHTNKGLVTSKVIWITRLNICNFVDWMINRELRNKFKKKVVCRVVMCKCKCTFIYLFIFFLQECLFFQFFSGEDYFYFPNPISPRLTFRNKGTLGKSCSKQVQQVLIRFTGFGQKERKTSVSNT